MGMDLILICFAALACLSSGLVFSASFLQLKGRTETIGALQFRRSSSADNRGRCNGSCQSRQTRDVSRRTGSPGDRYLFELIGTLLLCFGAVCWLIAF